MISLKEIGRICGLSESTVSKALKGNPAIRHSTMLRVMEVARKYGYQPNAMVHCMQTGQSQSIGIAYNDFCCQFAGQVMEGIQQVLHENNYDSFVIQWDKLVKDKIELLGRFARRRVDGILLFPPAAADPSERLAELRSIHCPIVVIDQRWPGHDFDYVGCDNRKGMYELVSFLIGRGYRRFGVIGFPGVSSGEERRSGFLDAMFEHKLPIDATLLANTTESIRNAYEVARALLTRSDRPDALVCFNDYIAREGINAAMDLGIAIPGELAVTGFGNLPLCNLIRPRLSTVDQFSYETGIAAAKLLLERISASGKYERRDVVIDTKVIIRESNR